MELEKAIEKVEEWMEPHFEDVEDLQEAWNLCRSILEHVRLRCLRCGHTWPSKDPMAPDLPKVCPKCKSPYWNKPRTR